MVRILFGANPDDSVWRIVSRFSPPQKALFLHSNKVKKNAILIAEEMGRDAFEVSLIRRAAIWHDVGKFRFPKLFFEHRGRFSEKQQTLQRAHSYASANIVQLYWEQLIGDKEMARLVAIMVAGHHWSYQESEQNYVQKILTPQFRYPLPDGSDNDFPLRGSRILKVADCFTASMELRDDGMRARPLNRYEAYAEIEKKSGTDFDPEAVLALSRLVRQSKIVCV